MKKVLFALLVIIFSALAVGCGTTAAVPAKTTPTIPKYKIGEEFPVSMDGKNVDYLATITGVTNPYDYPGASPYMTFGPKPGYKYVKVSMRVRNTGSYPGFFSPLDFLLLNERGDPAIEAATEPGNTLFDIGGDVLPGQEVSGSLIYQAANAAVPTTIRANAMNMPEVDLSS